MGTYPSFLFHAIFVSKGDTAAANQNHNGFVFLYAVVTKRAAPKVFRFERPKLADFYYLKISHGSSWFCRA